MPVSRVWLIAVFFASALVGCSGGSEKKLSAADTATFLVDPISAVSEDVSTDQNFSNVPTSRLINFTACLKDIAVLEPVVGANFSLSDKGQLIPLKSDTTDAKGCLYWSENFPFVATNQETYYEVERVIEAMSVHKGRVALRLGINPWRKGGDGVKDLRFQSAPPALNGGQAASSGESALVIESLNADLEVVRSADSVAEANLQLSFQPKIRRTGIDGSRILESLTGGKFRLRAQLVAASADSAVPLTAVADFPAGFVKDSVQGRGKVKILRKIPREALLELNFEAIPVDAPAALRPVKGRVSLGRLTSLSLSRNAPLRPDDSINFSAPLPSAGAGENAPFGFELGRVRVENVVVVAMDSTGFPRGLELELVTCVRNSLSQEKVLDQAFEVSLDGKKNPLKTDGELGCLKWKQAFTFDYHAKENFLVKDLFVRSRNSFYGKDVAQRRVHLNLWKYESPDKIVVDETYDGVPSAGVAGSASELLLSSMMFNFMGRTFQIDPHLNLSTTRKYRFEIQPKIRRFSRDKGWLEPQSSGNGRYQVRFLLETMDLNHPRVVDAKTVEAESRAGTITATVDFHLEDIRLVSTRLNLSVEVLPIDRASSLETKPYTGSFDMGGFSVRLEPRNGKIESRMKEGMKPNAALAKAGKEIFAASRKHLRLDEAKLQELGLAATELEKYFQTKDHKLLGKLCALYFKPNGWFSSYKSCAKKPDDYLALVTTEFVQKMHGGRLARQPETSTLSVSAGLLFSEYESHDDTDSKNRSYSVDSNARLSVPLIELLGIDIGIGGGVSDSWNTTKSHTKGRSKGQVRGTDQSKQMSVDEAEFEIVADIDQCLLIANRDESKEVYMACAPKPVRKKVRESYYLIYQPTVASALVDPGAALAERPFLSLVRGRGRFQFFAKLLKDPEVTLNFQKSLPAPADIMREAENRYDGFFPGLLTPQP